MLRNGALTREPSPLEQSDMARVAGITAYLASVGVENNPVLFRPTAGGLRADLWIIRAAAPCGADRTSAVISIGFLIALGGTRDTRSP